MAVPAAQPAQQAPQAPASPIGAAVGAFCSKALQNYGKPLAYGLYNAVTANPGTTVLATFAAGLLLDRYNSVNYPKQPGVVTDEFSINKPDFDKRTKRRKMKEASVHLPLRLHRTDEMDAVNWKLRIKNISVLFQLALAIGFIAAACSTYAVGSSAAVSLFGWTWNFGQQFTGTSLLCLGILAAANTYMTVRIGEHLKMDKYTIHTEKKEHNKAYNLNKAKYRSNLNNTIRFVAASFFPITPFAFFGVKLHEWRREGKKLNRLYHRH